MKPEEDLENPSELTRQLEREQVGSGCSETPETDAFRERVRSGEHPDYWSELARMERERDEARRLASDFRRRWSGERFDPSQNYTLAPLPWGSPENADGDATSTVSDGSKHRRAEVRHEPQRGL